MARGTPPIQEIVFQNQVPLPLDEKRLATI